MMMNMKIKRIGIWDLELGNLNIQLSGIAVCETMSMQIIEEDVNSY